MPGPLMATTTILNLKDGGKSQCQRQPNQHRKHGKRGGLFSHKPFNPGDGYTRSKRSLFSLDHFNSAAWFCLGTWFLSVPAVQHAINRSHICRVICNPKQHRGTQSTNSCASHCVQMNHRRINHKVTGLQLGAIRLHSSASPVAARAPM